ncbi:MAG: hypothetical protein DLM52_03580 [Chthoniobacterales bacterium]|nr:MAG: hypothetical protein DLM52_03580 [Chthoniobacterales bacterium]
MRLFPKHIGSALLGVLVVANAHGFILDEEIFSVRSADSLAQRDEYGLLHQSKDIYATDWEQRNHCRFVYYFKPPEQVMAEPAYVGALQRDLRRLGYYCGPIDGIFSAEVSDAIARLQKNYSMRVTGTLTSPVRRALHLP